MTVYSCLLRALFNLNLNIRNVHWLKVWYLYIWKYEAIVQLAIYYNSLAILDQSMAIGRLDLILYLSVIKYWANLQSIGLQIR